MKNVYNIIKTVAMTEKSNALMEIKQGDEIIRKYTFIVDPKSTKYDVKLAIQKVFERKVKAVNMINRQGKAKRTKYGPGKRADYKKAIVTLKKGEQAIDIL